MGSEALGDGKLKKLLRDPVGMNIKEDNGDIWFAAADRNGLYRVDGKSYEIIEKHIFEMKTEEAVLLYHNVEINTQRIFMAPHRADKIAVYDIAEKKMHYLDLAPVAERYKHIYCKNLKFGGAFQDESNVYLLGYTYPAIIKIQTETLEMHYIDAWVDELEGEAEKGFLTMGIIKRGRKAFLPIGSMCALLELDLDTDQTKVIRLNNSLEGIGGIAEDNEGTIWMVGRGAVLNKIVGWHAEKNECKEIDIPITAQEEGCGAAFYEPICYGERFFLFPIYAEHIYEVNPKTGMAVICECLDSLVKVEQKGKVANLPMRTFSPRVVDGKLKFVTNRDQRWHEYDLQTAQIESFFLQKNENIKEIEESVLDFFQKNIMQEDLYSLDYYIDFITYMDENQIIKNENIIGEKIYSALASD